ncbi:MAG: hypothetical protein H0T48_12680 [Gemmatimonadaceae bacterium]|nr:hypothetical protein [Gemmatimonadaceae bacterium]
MRFSRRRLVQVSAIVAIACAAWLGVSGVRREVIADAAGERSLRMAEVAERDIQIAAWEKALVADPQSAIALGQLAALHSQRARETGDETGYAEAEAYARRSVAIRTNRNGSSFATLALALLAQHRFMEADSIATELVRRDPDVPQYNAMLGEIKMEIGDYAAARTAFARLHRQRNHLSIAPRLARWHELNGRVSEARALLSQALEDAVIRRDLPREQVAWFHLRAGELELRHGRPRTARSIFEKGLVIEPKDYRLLSALARLEAAEGNTRSAVAYGEHALAIRVDPATLGIVGDAHAAMGDDRRAEMYFRTMEVAVEGQPAAFHRASSLFLLDHGRRTPEVLAAARAETAVRRDVYGYDLLAWALHKSHRNREASQAIAQALRLGTRDPLILYHAGVIAHALGRAAASRSLLEQALAVNPRFDATHPDHARLLLEEMGD